MSWYLGALKKYAVFSGRARRKEYWMFFLFNIIVSFFVGLVAGFVGALMGQGPALANAANVLYGLAIVLPALAVAVRRMHDLGRSGWWVIVPVANLIFLCTAGQAGDNQYGPDPKAAEPA